MDNNIIGRRRFSCLITKATDTHSEYFMLFHGNSGYANAPQYYVLRTLPVLLINLLIYYHRMYILIVQYLLDCMHILSEQARCSTRCMSAYFFESRSENTRKLTMHMFWVTYFRVKFNDDCSDLIILLSLYFST